MPCSFVNNQSLRTLREFVPFGSILVFAFAQIPAPLTDLGDSADPEESIADNERQLADTNLDRKVDWLFRRDLESLAVQSVRPVGIRPIALREAGSAVVLDQTD